MKLNNNIIILMNAINERCKGYKLHRLLLEERASLTKVNFRKGDKDIVIILDAFNDLLVEGRNLHTYVEERFLDIEDVDSLDNNLINDVVISINDF